MSVEAGRLILTTFFYFVGIHEPRRSAACSACIRRRVRLALPELLYGSLSLAPRRRLAPRPRPAPRPRARVRASVGVSNPRPAALITGTPLRVLKQRAHKGPGDPTRDRRGPGRGVDTDLAPNFTETERSKNSIWSSEGHPGKIVLRKRCAFEIASGSYRFQFYGYKSCNNVTEKIHPTTLRLHDVFDPFRAAYDDVEHCSVQIRQTDNHGLVIGSRYTLWGQDPKDSKELIGSRSADCYRSYRDYHVFDTSVVIRPDDPLPLFGAWRFYANIKELKSNLDAVAIVSRTDATSRCDDALQRLRLTQIEAARRHKRTGKDVQLVDAYQSNDSATQKSTTPADNMTSHLLFAVLVYVRLIRTV
ncbi:hypothetical protein EVAR_78667_1 [Eumeta japonica]|uniref:Uncharacterized protein n=1 Tax=Eumeta variegata TaxID=151549 RepID=A0A4C1U8Q8_EUMVA|nr:hypothetical protein EVAR_78667_1 [Eumeta japonica]